jgi:hypothetical protein
MIEDFDESNLVDYQGYIRDEIIDFEEKNNEIEQDESIDDESSEVGWNNEDEKKYYSKNNSELNETCIIHEEMDKELMDEELMNEELMNEEMDKELMNEEMDEELINEEMHEEMDEELMNEEMDEEVVVEEKKEEEQHAWYYGLKEEIVQEEPNVVYESFTPEKKPLVQEEINNQETNSNNKKCFWGIIWDFINIFSK